MPKYSFSVVLAAVLVHVIAHPAAEAIASLRRSADGRWEVVVAGPKGLISDPASLQLSLLPVGSKPSALAPTIQITGGALTSASGEVRHPASIMRHGPPGFVRLSASGLAHLPVDGAGTTSEVPVRPADAFIYLPIEMEAPGAAPGQRFLCMPTERPAFKSGDGVDVPAESTNWREARLERYERIGEKRFLAAFRLEGWPGEVILRGDDNLAKVRGLAPIVWDPAVRALRTKYIGKQAFMYGGFGFSIEPPHRRVSVGAGLPVKVRSILRLYRPKHRVSFDGTPISSPGGFECDHPLVAIIEAPGSIDSAGERMLAVIADDWHFERLLSPMSGVDQHPEWTPEQALEVTEGRLEMGADPAMAAWILGWPPEPGLKTEFLKASRWRFMGRADGIEEVNFKDGKLTGIKRKAG